MAWKWSRVNSTILRGEGKCCAWLCWCSRTSGYKRLSVLLLGLGETTARAVLGLVLGGTS